MQPSFLVAEGFIKIRRVVKRGPMRDDEGGSISPASIFFISGSIYLCVCV